MLKDIPSILSPELLKIIMEMGHGDELVIGDGNFPSSSYAKRLVRLDGHGICEILTAILKFFPLDVSYDNFILMERMDCDLCKDVSIWKEYEKIGKNGDSGFKKLTFLERFEFYERSKKAYAILATGEEAIYANIILKKGIC